MSIRRRFKPNPKYAPFDRPRAIKAVFLQLVNVEYIIAMADCESFMKVSQIFVYSTVELLQKVVHVARNPKSVATSIFNFYKGLAHVDYRGTFDSFLPTFLEGLSMRAETKFEFSRDSELFCKQLPQQIIFPLDVIIKLLCTFCALSEAKRRQKYYE